MSAAHTSLHLIGGVHLNIWPCRCYRGVIESKYSEQAEFFAFFCNFADVTNVLSRSNKKTQRLCNIKNCMANVWKKRVQNPFRLKPTTCQTGKHQQATRANIHTYTCIYVRICGSRYTRVYACVLPNLLLTLTHSIALAIDFLLKYLL